MTSFLHASNEALTHQETSASGKRIREFVDTWSRFRTVRQRKCA